MIQVALLTETQKNQLVGQYYSDDSIFNPIQDNDNNWVISTVEVTTCTNEEFMWVQDLELIPFVPKPAPSPPIPPQI
jgi:hypothetical protein